MTSKRFALVLLAIVALAAGVRFAGLGRDGLWTDEATTVVLASRPVPDLLRALRADVQSPLHYLLVKPMLGLGEAEWVPRLLSALAGTLTVALCGILGRARIGDAGALFAALVLALHPMHVTQSREARAYALLALGALLAYAAVDALRREPSRRRVALAALAVGALPLIHGLGTLQAAAIALAAALPSWAERSEWRRRALPGLAAAGAGSLLVAAPWLLTTAGQGARAGVAYAWAQRAWDAAFPWQVPLSLMALAPGASAPERSLWRGPVPLDVVAAALGILLVALAWRSRARLPDPSSPARLGGAVLGSLGLVFLASLAIGPLHVVGRVEAALAPLVALALGAASAGLSRRALAVAVVAVAAISGLALRTALTADVRSDERELGRLICRVAGEQDVVVVLGAWRFPVELAASRCRPGLLVVSFPDEREAHPSWIDWSSHDEARLRTEAAVLAARLRARLDETGGDDAWLLAVPEPGTAALREALERTIGAGQASPLPLPGMTLERFRAAGP